jgi:osmotically-inducible protein OsmY
MVLGRLMIRHIACLAVTACWFGTTGITMAQEVKPEGTAPPPQSKPEVKPPEGKTPEPGKVELGKVVSSPMLTTKLALMADPRLFPYDITVEMTGEILILTGKVPDEPHKAVAGEIAKTFAKSVKNKLDPDKDIDREITRKKDDTITSYVKERFAKSKTLEKADFGVKTDDGVVSLTGKTRFQVIVLEAAEAVRQVPGVKAVKADGVRIEGD